MTAIVPHVPSLQAAIVESLPAPAYKAMPNARVLVDQCVAAVLTACETHEASAIRRWLDVAVKPIPPAALGACLETVIGTLKGYPEYCEFAAMLSDLEELGSHYLACISSASIGKEPERRSEIETLAHLIEIVDPNAGEHCETVSNFARRLAISARLEPEQVHMVDYAGRVILLGNYVSIASQHITFADKLTVSGTTLANGAALLSRMPLLRDVGEVLHCAGECVDGSGPLGLVGSEIPIESRILAIAYWFSGSLAQTRNFEVVPASLLAARDVRFDGDLVNEFLRVIGYRRSLSMVVNNG